jgi:hypothetical protein
MHRPSWVGLAVTVGVGLAVDGVGVVETAWGAEAHATVSNPIAAANRNALKLNIVLQR